MATKAVSQEAGPEEGSEVRFGRAKGRRGAFWLGKSPRTTVEAAPSMARVEDAWNKEGLQVEDVEQLQRLQRRWGVGNGP